MSRSFLRLEPAEVVEALSQRCTPGSSFRDSCVEQLRVREATVEGPGLVGFGDGEMLGPTPLQVCSVPSALPVFVP